MKICLIELMPFPYTVGGGTTHIMNLGNILTKMGNEVYVISSKPADNYKKLKYPKGLKIINVGMKHKMFNSSLKYYVYRILFEASFIFSAIKAIKKIKPDVIDCQSPITTALPASLSGYPFVITCHGIHSLGFGKLYAAKDQSFVSKYLNRIYEIISKYNVRRASKILSQGKETLNHYVKMDGDSKKGVMLPNMVDTEFWKPKKKKKNNLIVTAARFTQQKSLDKLVSAMNFLKKFKLKLIGGGEMEEELKSLAKTNTEFLGVLTLDQIKKEYDSARFTVLPSKFEGFPYSILEAMAAGIIPVVTKVGDLRELIRHGKNGFFLKDDKPETIAKVLKRVKKKNMKKISENARKTIIEGYSLEAVGKQFLETYKSL